MYEFTMRNKNTNEQDFWYGYSLDDAINRRKKNNPNFNENEWEYLFRDYID